jgi:hypothetical protein
VRRLMIGVIGAVAALAALAVGPFGAAAGAPYVYGCTPGQAFSASGDYLTILSVYNGSATAANLVTKILAFDGQILNAPSGAHFSPVPLTFTLDATRTYEKAWNSPGSTALIRAASVRVVSNVPVSATLTHRLGSDGNELEVTCTPMQP